MIRGAGPIQAAFTLGELRDDRAIAALEDILAVDVADRWVRTAVLSSVPESAVKLLSLIADKPASFFTTFCRHRDHRQLATVGARHDAEEVAACHWLVADAGPALLAGNWRPWPSWRQSSPAGQALTEKSLPSPAPRQPGPPESAGHPGNSADAGSSSSVRVDAVGPVDALAFGTGGRIARVPQPRESATASHQR